MGNMSYCRFRNTLTDMRDCIEAVEDYDFDPDELSEEEQKAYDRLYKSCLDFVREHDDRDWD